MFRISLILAVSSLIICLGSAQEKVLNPVLPAVSPPPSNSTAGQKSNSSTTSEAAPIQITTIAIANATNKILDSAIDHLNSTITNSISDLKKPSNFIDGTKIIIDLSHPLDNNTLHWPTVAGFNYTSQKDGELHNQRHEPYYLKSDSFSTAVHCGTHLDAPRHFSKSGWTVDKIPLERLVDVPVHVIDLSQQVKANRTYSFKKDDFIESVSKKPKTTAGSVVLVYTGISEYYSQGKKAYFGADTNNVSELRIPGFSREAAQYLVDVGVFGVGLDAPSADSSDKHDISGSMDPVAHVIFNSNNIYILENISNRLSEMLRQDANLRLTIAPLAIVEGSGSPVRLLAVTAHNDCVNLVDARTITSSGFVLYPYATMIVASSLSAFVAILIFMRH